MRCDNLCHCPVRDNFKLGNSLFILSPFVVTSPKAYLHLLPTNGSLYLFESSMFNYWVPLHRSISTICRRTELPENPLQLRTILICRAPLPHGASVYRESPPDWTASLSRRSHSLVRPGAPKDPMNTMSARSGSSREVEKQRYWYSESCASRSVTGRLPMPRPKWRSLLAYAGQASSGVVWNDTGDVSVIPYAIVKSTSPSLSIHWRMSSIGIGLPAAIPVLHRT